MTPALLPGTVVFASGRYKGLRKADIVIFVHHGVEKIKRVKGLTDEQVYVVGDNSNSSTDSRSFGWIDRSQIIAKVFWPRQ